MVRVVLTSVLAEQAHGQKTFEIEAKTVGEALRALTVADLLLDEHGELRPLALVIVEGTDVRERGGLTFPLLDGQEMRILGAVAGG